MTNGGRGLRWAKAAAQGSITDHCGHRRDGAERLKGGVWNPSNANRDMKAAMVRVNPDLAWVTSHTCRKTVVTRLDEAGPSVREIADRLGHAKPSLTQDVPLGPQRCVATVPQPLLLRLVIKWSRTAERAGQSCSDLRVLEGGGGGNRTPVL
ncbi:phage integrase family protein [Kribbella sp. VKM Ac-2527]|uniref:Phage integrase family protein n=1 Tax=Kribbella caucasensis TaxID=2512215 RepID=A0A4R6KKP1_9ACTN|nr:phage integrase family protein [Kribbella sp. VKM Ac-2527]